MSYDVRMTHSVGNYSTRGRLIMLDGVTEKNFEYTGRSLCLRW